MTTANNNSNTRLPLQGKTALVTGSARGIGAAIAWKLASEGADVSDLSPNDWTSTKFEAHDGYLADHNPSPE
jgi:NAD(P)-dependent dehydrogenase (short-subunit alcohol dehydrogenase family)